MMNELLTSGRGGRSTNDGRPPTPWMVALRPFGYLLMGVIWTVILMIVLLIPIGTAAYLVLDDPAAVVETMSQTLSNPAQAAAWILMLVPLMAVIMGGMTMWQLPTACWPLAALAFIYVGRSLRPAFAGERLSYTTWQAKGETFGPPTATDVSMSLQPVRRTALTDAIMRYYVAGWTIDIRMHVAMLPAGVAWMAAVVALMPGVPAPARIVAAVLAVLLLGFSAVLAVRTFRARHAAPERDVQSVPVTALTPAERRKRLRAVQARRR